MKSIILLLVAAGLCQGAYTSLATVNFAGATSSTQTNITLVASFNDVKMKTVANGGEVQNTVSRNGFTVPTDVIVTNDASCATLTGSYKWDFESYSATAGTGFLWILIPSYTTGGVTPTICVGDAAVTTYQGGAVGTAYANTAGAWMFPDGSSLSLTDFFGAHNLTGTNTPTATSGKVDGAMALASASSQYASTSSDVISGAMTVEAWVNGTSFPGAYNTVTGAEGASTYFDIHVKSTGKLAMYMVAQSPVFYDGTGTNTLSTGTWYHLAMVYSAAGGLIGYVNGGVDGTAATTGNAITTPGNIFAVGNNPPGSPTRYFNGKIDGVRVYSTALTANYIATEYGNQNSPPAVGSFSPVPVPDYSVSGPTRGKLGVASTNFTVTKTSGTFNGSNTITFTASASATFTPSVGSPSASPITVTPTNGSSSFTFTVQAAAVGAITITPTNNFGGLDPDPFSYTTGYSCVSAASANWSVSSTWTSCGTGGVPQNGDTAAISHAVSVNDTEVVGTSPVQGGTPAITLGTTGTLTISSGGSVTVRGPVTSGAGTSAAVTVSGGGTWTWDSTASASPATTAYEFTPSGHRGVALSGTSSSCTYNGRTWIGATCAIMTSNLSGGALGGNLDGITQDFSKMQFTSSYGAISNLGSASVPAIYLQEFAFNTAANLTIDHTSFYNSGVVSANAQINVSVTNSAFAAGVAAALFVADTGSGTTKTVTDNYFGTLFQINSMNGAWNLSRNYYAGTGPELNQASAGSASTSTGDNALYAVTQDDSIKFPYSPTNPYVFYNKTAVDNPHFTDMTTFSTTITGIICESPDDISADPGECIGKPTAGTFTTTVNNMLLIPSKTLVGTAGFAAFTNNTSSGYNMTVSHATGLCGGNCMQVDEAGATAAHASITSSIMGSANGTAIFKAYSYGGASPSTDPFTVADYNAGLPIITLTSGSCSGCTNQGKGYVVKSSAPNAYGVHDLDITNGSPVAPGFVNMTYRMATWDTLGTPANSACTAWATSTTYTYPANGTTPTCVSVNNGGSVYGGLSINYRLTATHTSGASTKPDSGANWRNDWEYASLYDLRIAMVLGTTYNGLTPIAALHNFVGSGWTPTSNAYRFVYPGESNPVSNLGAFQMAPVSGLKSGNALFSGKGLNQ